MSDNSCEISSSAMDATRALVESAFQVLMALNRSNNEELKTESAVLCIVEVVAELAEDRGVNPDLAVTLGALTEGVYPSDNALVEVLRK